MKKDFKNIPSQTVTTDFSNNEIKTIKAEFNTSGEFTFKMYALTQFVHSLHIMYLGKAEHEQVKANNVKLLTKLAVLLTEPKFDEQGANLDKYTIRLDRKEVEILANLLPIKINHCEEQRDARNDAFNPDSYIAMQLLLLELKTWLTFGSYTVISE